MNIEYRIADICNHFIEDVSPETVRTIVRRTYDLIERVGYSEDEAIDTACDEYCNDELNWYAVMADDEDTDWSYGSFALSEAKDMLKSYPQGYIAVIKNGCCVDEIRKESTMRKFILSKHTGEIKSANEIRQGCIAEKIDADFTIIETYDTKEKALEALKKHDTEINEYPGYFLITEYSVEEVEVDEDEEITDFLGIWEYSKLTISVVDWEKDTVIGEFDNYEDASKAEDEYIEQVEADGETIANTRIKFRKF